METQKGKNFDPDIVQIASKQKKESPEFHQLAIDERLSLSFEKIKIEVAMDGTRCRSSAAHAIRSSIE